MPSMNVCMCVFACVYEFIGYRLTKTKEKKIGTFVIRITYNIFMPEQSVHTT